MTEPEVSGKAFLGLIRHVKDTRGLPYLNSLVGRCADSTQQIFTAPIRANDWHPYDAYTSFLREIERSLGGGDEGFARKLGAIAGKRDLGTIFRVYAALASAERLIRASQKIWPSYHRNAGHMEAISWDPSDTRLRIFEFAAMDPAHCRLMEGWMIATMAMIGFKVGPDARETKCMSRGAPFHEFACTWVKAK